MILINSQKSSPLIISCVFFLLLFFSFEAFPVTPCPDNPEEEWSDCIGSFVYEDGSTFAGEWKDNSVYKGVFTWYNGDIYIGELDGDVPHGFGTIYFKQRGDIYEGQWKKDKMDGQGIYIMRVDDSEYTIYVGDFKDNKFDGLGLYTTPDGIKYYGHFKKGLRHGEGKLIYPNRESLEVFCKEDICSEIK